MVTCGLCDRTRPLIHVTSKRWRLKDDDHYSRRFIEVFLVCLYLKHSSASNLLLNASSPYQPCIFVYVVYVSFTLYCHECCVIYRCLFHFRLQFARPVAYNGVKKLTWLTFLLGQLLYMATLSYAP